MIPSLILLLSVLLSDETDKNTCSCFLFTHISESAAAKTKRAASVCYGLVTSDCWWVFECAGVRINPVPPPRCSVAWLSVLADEQRIVGLLPSFLPSMSALINLKTLFVSV